MNVRKCCDLIKKALYLLGLSIGQKIKMMTNRIFSLELRKVQILRIRMVILICGISMGNRNQSQYNKSILENEIFNTSAILTAKFLTKNHI